MNLTPSILNVIRVALDRADMNYRATGFKPFELDAAKAWITTAAAPQLPAQAPALEAPASEWDVRGHLAATLTCWHRLTGQEAAELVALFRGRTAQAQEPVKRVYLVATGEEHEGEATYTRYDDAPPPLCDAECLFSYPAPQQAAREVVMMPNYDLDGVEWVLLQQVLVKLGVPTGEVGEMKNNVPRFFNSVLHAVAAQPQQAVPTSEQAGAQIAWDDWRKQLAEKVDDYIQADHDGEGDDEAYADLKAHILKTPFAAPASSGAAPVAEGDALQRVSDFGQLQTALELVGELRQELAQCRADNRRAVLALHRAELAAQSAHAAQGDAEDADRYRTWRDNMIADTGAAFHGVVAAALPPDVGVDRRPTADEWDAAIDAARAQAKEGGGND